MLLLSATGELCVTPHSTSTAPSNHPYLPPLHSVLQSFAATKDILPPTPTNPTFTPCLDLRSHHVHIHLLPATSYHHFTPPHLSSTSLTATPPRRPPLSPSVVQWQAQLPAAEGVECSRVVVISRVCQRHDRHHCVLRAAAARVRGDERVADVRVSCTCRQSSKGAGAGGQWSG